MLETNNLLAHPAGLDLVLGEGTYALRDDLLLATPPPHPSEVPPANNNPLATTLGPPAAGTRLSLVVLGQRAPPAHGVFGHQQQQPPGGARAPIPSIQEEAQSPKSDAGSVANGFGSASYYTATPAFGEGNPALAPTVGKGKRKEERLKPKNNIVKSSSSFVSRVTPHEAMQKRLAERAHEGILAFANVNRAFLWLDLASADMKTENMTKVLFTKAHVLCHDVNPMTKSTGHLDVVMGFNTGDVIWYEPISQKYARMNKNGAVNSSPVCDVRWLPGKENLFLAAHMDGRLVVYDKEKEDAEFVREDDTGTENGEVQGVHVDGSRTDGAARGVEIEKSVQSRNQKFNPVAVWKVGKSKVNRTAFSPDGQHLAAVSEDGTLTVMDYIGERVLDVHRGYYGALLTVTWSPDGRYVLTGGQDDLVSVWSFAERALVARCVGHESWVREVKFDPWRCDERNYRFGSVGEDCRLLLWDFSVGMLGRPKATSVLARGSVSGGMQGGAGRKESSAAIAGRLRSTSSLTQQVDRGEGVQDMVHAVDGKATTPVLPPVMSKIVDEHPLCWLGFEEHCILTSCDNGGSFS